MVTLQLWAGVAFMALAGLVCGFNFVQHAKGRYIPEERGNQVEQAVFGIFRWIRAVTYAVAATLCFIGAAWLTKYILTLPAGAGE
jgi:hypothetical protein